MNESGLPLERSGVIEQEELLVVCDDLNLPLGQLRLRKRGGSGAHKGLCSIIEHLGTENFPRLRMGIGAPPPGTDWVEFVLSRFRAEEQDCVERMIESAADAIEVAVRSGVDEAMQRFNRPGPDAAEDG
jgi:PTH1 family peptidyl-tRNA hydrolase